MGNFLHIPYGTGLNVKALLFLLLLFFVNSFSDVTLSASASYSDSRGSDGNCSAVYPNYEMSWSSCNLNCVPNNSTNIVCGMSNGTTSEFLLEVPCDKVFITSHKVTCSGSIGYAYRDDKGCHGATEGFYKSEEFGNYLGAILFGGTTPYNISCSATYSFSAVDLDCEGRDKDNYFLCPNNRPNPDCSSPVPVSMEECKGGQGLVLAGNEQQLDSAISGLSLGSDAAWLDYPLQNQLDTALSRPDSSVCSLGNASGQKFTRLVCPLGFEPDSTGECYIEPEPPLLRKGIRDRYETPPMPDYGLDWSSKSFYDARGRRAQAEPNTRRYLFSGEKNKPVVRETELGMESLLRNSPSGLCCVDSFSVKRRGDIDDASVVSNGKVGVEVDFYAEFGKGNGCNPECCEFKQESMGYILRNDSLKNETTCRIDGEYITYSDTEYVPDCYGRDCNNILESYNDTLGTYNGWDHPGLKSVGDSTSVDIRMEFNSYIEDKCSNPKEIKETRYWGFHIQGTPYYGLTPTLLGEINK